MINLNKAIATGRISTGDTVTFKGMELVASIKESTISLLDEGGLAVHILPRFESHTTGTGQYLLSANNIITHTFEHKLLED